MTCQYVVEKGEAQGKLTLMPSLQALLATGHSSVWRAKRELKLAAPRLRFCRGASLMGSPVELKAAKALVAVRVRRMNARMTTESVL